MKIRLIDIDDESHVLAAEVIARRLHVVTIRHTVQQPRMFRAGKHWERRFDVRSGLDLGDHPAFRIHPDDLGKLSHE
jgi:hypothetical protein